MGGAEPGNLILSSLLLGLLLSLYPVKFFAYDLIEILVDSLSVHFRL